MICFYSAINDSTVSVFFFRSCSSWSWVSSTGFYRTNTCIRYQMKKKSSNSGRAKRNVYGIYQGINRVFFSLFFSFFASFTLWRPYENWKSIFKWKKSIYLRTTRTDTNWIGRHKNKNYVVEGLATLYHSESQASTHFTAFNVFQWLSILAPEQRKKFMVFYYYYYYFPSTIKNYGFQFAA